MNVKKSLENLIRGWLPKEPSRAVAHETLKPRWRNPYWLTLTLVVAVALAGVVYFGVNTYLRYSNPLMDITASYYEKTVNSTTANVGDVIEVKVLVGWHGYVIPEFKRDVKVVDSFPESRFVLVNGTSVYEYKGYGGSDQFTYELRVIAEGNVVELPKPRLYLDNVEIPLAGTSPTLNIASK
jgi:hypothetical protein